MLGLRLYTYLGLSISVARLTGYGDHGSPSAAAAQVNSQYPVQPKQNIATAKSCSPGGAAGLREGVSLSTVAQVSTVALTTVSASASQERMK